MSRRGVESGIYALLRTFNSAKAVNRTLTSGSPRPVVRRVGRVAYGKFTGRLGGKWLR